MKGLGEWLRGVPRTYLLGLIAAVVLLGGGTAIAVWENEEKEALKETIRAYFSAKDEESRGKAWEELVKSGAQDFEFVLWGLENTNSVFMFEQGKLDELVVAIEKSLGNPEGVLACCRNALHSELSVGKVVAMDVLAKHKDLLTPLDMQNTRAVLMNSAELGFVRIKAAEFLGGMKAKEAAEDFISVLGSSKETVVEPSTVEGVTTNTEKSVDVPLALREVCLVQLAAVAPEKAGEEVRKVLENAETPFRLVKRAVACGVEAGGVDVLAERLGKETDADKQAELAKGLVRLGGERALAAVQSAVASSQGNTLRAAVLDAVAESKALGFEEIIRGALRSDVKGLRLRAIAAAKSLPARATSVVDGVATDGAAADGVATEGVALEGTATAEPVPDDLSADLERVAVTGTLEEQYLLEAVSR